jgi:hypothetical protein
MYKLMYEPLGFKPKILAERFMCTSRTADLDEARAFFKKLVSLDLVTEVEEENQQVEGEPGLNHMPSLLHRDSGVPGALQRH